VASRCIQMIPLRNHSYLRRSFTPFGAKIRPTNPSIQKRIHNRERAKLTPVLEIFRVKALAACVVKSSSVRYAFFLDLAL
jgi:hypothetical protein